MSANGSDWCATDGRQFSESSGKSALRAFPDVPIATLDHETATRFFNQCRAKGVTGSAIDLLVCSVSHRLHAPVYTTDSDFARYARLLGISLHRPASA